MFISLICGHICVSYLSLHLRSTKFLRSDHQFELLEHIFSGKKTYSASFLLLLSWASISLSSRSSDLRFTPFPATVPVFSNTDTLMTSLCGSETSIWGPRAPVWGPGTSVFVCPSKSWESVVKLTSAEDGNREDSE